MGFLFLISCGICGGFRQEISLNCNGFCGVLPGGVSGDVCVNSLCDVPGTVPGGW